MGDRIKVSAEVVKEKWFSPESKGMTHDHQTKEVVVHMKDGSSYACTFAEHSALLKAEDNG